MSEDLLLLLTGRASLPLRFQAVSNLTGFDHFRALTPSKCLLRPARLRRAVLLTILTIRAIFFAARATRAHGRVHQHPERIEGKSDG